MCEFKMFAWRRQWHYILSEMKSGHPKVHVSRDAHSSFHVIFKLDSSPAIIETMSSLYRTKYNIEMAHDGVVCYFLTTLTYNGSLHQTKHTLKTLSEKHSKIIYPWSNFCNNSSSFSSSSSPIIRERLTFWHGLSSMRKIFHHQLACLTLQKLWSYHILFYKWPTMT